MSNQDWLARYQARKRGAPPQQPQPSYQAPPAYIPPPPPSPGYGGYPPPQQQPVYPQPVGPQPLPGAPQHAPFGYDQATGVPLAPYGRDQYGNVVVQPQYYQQPSQPAYDPRGQVMAQGYGQPPYGAPGQPQPQDATFVGSDGQIHIDWAKAPLAYQGGQGTQESKPCPQCREGFLIPTDATGEARVLNVRTGVFAYPAAHCARCGYNGVSTPGESSGAVGAAAGAGVQVVGNPRMAPGAGNVQQVQSQHGLPNLFAPKP